MILNVVTVAKKLSLPFKLGLCAGMLALSSPDVIAQVTSVYQEYDGQGNRINTDRPERRPRPRPAPGHYGGHNNSSRDIVRKVELYHTYRAGQRLELNSVLGLRQLMPSQEVKNIMIKARAIEWGAQLLLFKNGMRIGSIALDRLSREIALPIANFLPYDQLEVLFRGMSAVESVSARISDNSYAPAPGNPYGPVYVPVNQRLNPGHRLDLEGLLSYSSGISPYAKVRHIQAALSGSATLVVAAQGQILQTLTVGPGNPRPHTGGVQNVMVRIPYGIELKDIIIRVSRGSVVLRSLEISLN